MFFCYLFCILFSFLIFTYPLGNDCLPAGRAFVSLHGLVLHPGRAFVSLHGLVLHRSMYFVVIIDHRSIVIGQFVSHSHKRLLPPSLPFSFFPPVCICAQRRPRRQRPPPCLGSRPRRRLPPLLQPTRPRLRGLSTTTRLPPPSIWHRIQPHASKGGC